MLTHHLRMRFLHVPIRETALQSGLFARFPRSQSFLRYLFRAEWVKDSTQGSPVCIATNEQHFPDLATDGEGGVIVVWQDARNENRDVFAQRVSADGEMLWTPDGVQVCNLPSEQIWPVVVSDANGGAIVVFGEWKKWTSRYLCPAN